MHIRRAEPRQADVFAGRSPGRRGRGTQPGHHGGLGVKSAPPAGHLTARTRQLTSQAPVRRGLTPAMFYAPKHSARKINPVRRRADRRRRRRRRHRRGTVMATATSAPRASHRLGPRRRLRERWQLVDQHRQRLLRRPAVLRPHLGRLRRRALRRHRQPRHQGPADHRRPEGPRPAGARRLADLWCPRRTDPRQRRGGRRRLDHDADGARARRCARRPRVRRDASPRASWSSTASAARRPTPPSSAGSGGSVNGTLSRTDIKALQRKVGSAARRRHRPEDDRAPCRPRSAPARTARTRSTAPPCARCRATSTPTDATAAPSALERVAFRPWTSSQHRSATLSCAAVCSMCLSVGCACRGWARAAVASAPVPRPFRGPGRRGAIGSAPVL